MYRHSLGVWLAGDEFVPERWLGSDGRVALMPSSRQAGLRGSPSGIPGGPWSHPLTTQPSDASGMAESPVKTEALGTSVRQQGGCCAGTPCK